MNKRIGQIAEGKQAWLNHLKDDGRIHGYVNTFGTATGRMSHSHPNLGQVPAVYSEYGPECRAMFIVPYGKVMVGCDASGLEARCLAHYMAKYDKGAYVKVILEGRKAEGTDVHSLNAKVLGCTRTTAKTFFYAFMYGGGNQKLGEILLSDPAYADFEGTASGLGKRMRGLFLESLPALKALTNAVQKVAKSRGFLIGLDGRKIYCRSPHSALNFLLQGAGAIIMKKALILAEDTFIRKALDAEFVLNVHDEFQVEADPAHGAMVGEAMQKAIIDAGTHFNFRCPLDGEYKIGKNWAETH